MARYDASPNIDGVSQICLSARIAGLQNLLDAHFLPVAADLQFKKILLQNICSSGYAIAERLAQQISVKKQSDQELPVGVVLPLEFDYELESED